MIRKAVGSDFNDYYRLICELEEQVFEKTSFHELYDRILNHPMYELYVYEENEQVIGIMTLFFSEKLHHNGLTGEILELDIQNGFRGRGIGSEMLKAALTAAEDRHALELELSSSMRRTDAHRFYENSGFRKDHYNFTLPLR